MYTQRQPTFRSFVQRHSLHTYINLWHYFVSNNYSFMISLSCLYQKWTPSNHNITITISSNTFNVFQHRTNSPSHYTRTSQFLCHHNKQFCFSEKYTTPNTNKNQWQLCCSFDHNEWHMLYTPYTLPHWKFVLVLC